MNVDTTKLMTISRQLSPIQNVIYQKRLDNVEYFSYMDSVINYTGRTRDVKSRISLAKAAFNKKETLSSSKVDLNMRKKLVKRYI
jgi:hypothetical protein